MDIILLIAIILLVVGVVLLLAGHLVPTVTPGAVNAGWGLIGLGVLLLVIWLILEAVDTSSIGDGDRGSVNRSSWGLSFGPAVWALWTAWRRRGVRGSRAAQRVPPRP